MTKSKTQADPAVTNCLVADKFTCEFTLKFFAEGGSPVFLTRNGRGEYVLLDVKEYDHMKSELELMKRLAEGERSAREKGWLTAEPTTEETSQPEESGEPAFDTSWASNDFEAMIPELPFTDWTVVNETDTIYELELGGLSTADGADTATGFEEDKDALITYINSLSAYGFSVEETGENYSWLVTNDEGNTIEFMCADGYCWITFTKAN